MTKQEFLETMRLALNGRLDSGQVMDNLQYYEEYINTEIRKGATEEEVLERLGDPRLIARTIAQTGGSSVSEAGRGGGSRWSGAEEEEYMPYGQSGEKQALRVFRVPAWVWILLVLVVVLLVISTIFSILAALLPILLPILVVVFLVKMFRDWIN